MLTAVPREDLERAITSSNYTDVYVFVWKDEKWDVLLIDADRISGVGTIACLPGTDIHGHQYPLLGAMEKVSTRAFPHIDMVFAVVSGKKKATVLFHRINELARQYNEDIKGPLLKLHTGMAILAAESSD